ncbi:hypothetical protein L6164_015786 [Bauhinia variegata]|uniref:Uncharacterized protein n=1 Tax=Bauhinia variegata TaxID=167791 RepID=A0ACB9NLR5_BAUVA|nr:hypothetical protein L6164_015786 [Bauhinia variegata]
MLAAMITRTICCLNLPPPPPATSKPSLPTNPPQVSLVRCWRRQCFCVVMGVAFSLTGVDVPNFNFKLVGGNEIAIANANAQPMSRSERKVNIEKWSEKRACASWRPNSLESIVPENLPRPKARRRYEAVDHSGSLDAPPLAAQALKHDANASCFSM